ncbi:cyanophycin synthetase [Clostridium butyricum]|uniref:Cyanophycin synthetase n=1 Tax=Clostridium butyricum E4 str. BoNT E BL5262 TaxID=632245 RepID=C4IEF3_CLOBU|nr:cyanophycin synthetase [Clostridium butyricum]EDT73492.1 cyanophycin synthetase [Clostridium butyricum 5521]EEP55189.1 cyanophycin synthase (L-aspartate-adding) [Clostridium butyricum E4 str. BoNT E BL5262]NFL31650.1 cyanophycin synthetase [Clostridium butyricum]NFS19692.1 cyanophycin synthetase [Clostridium butyricum]
MKIVKKRIYEGKNIYSHKKCIRIDVDLEGYSEIPSKKIPNFNFNIVEILPELKKHRCGIDEEGGFVKRLEEGTYLAHICEHCIIAIQNILGMDVSYGKAREIKGELYYIIVQYEYENTAIEIINLAVDLINSLIKSSPINFNGRLQEIKQTLQRETIGPSTKSICDAAKNYGLPVTELGKSGIYQIGYGKQGRIIEAAISNKTNCVGVDISCDKFLTKQLLDIQNIPVAEGRKVFNIIGLLREAEFIGYPVVIKPQYGNKGKGVMLNLKNEKELIKAYTSLLKITKDIIIEKYVKGNDYRICVVDYKVVAASLRVVPFVIGDGKSNIKALINILNNDPLRGQDHEKPLTTIKFDKELCNCLYRQNMSLDYIPNKGEKVILRENANLSTGGIAVDCTDDVCDENIDYCIRAAKALGLDICGVDICTEDISIPINKQNGIVMEVNAAPGIRMHHFPSQGKKRDVGKAIVDMLYEGRPSNIPVISVTGTNGKTTTTRMIGHVLKMMGMTTGITSTDGIYINDKCIHKGDDSGFNSAKTLLLNRDVEAVVLETARGGLVRRGLAYDLADVAVITNITNDHLGLDGIDSMEDLMFVKSLVGEEVKKNGYTVINADDKYSKRILDRISCEKIYFSKSKDNELIKENINNGKIAVFIEDNNICVINNHRKYLIISIDELPISYNGILTYNIENAMAACAALVGLNIDYCMISKGFSDFMPCDDNEGRFNMFEYYGRKVILDYGHNIEGYKAVLSCINKLKTKNRLIGVVGVPGDRQDNVIKEIGEICCEYLDEIIIKEDKDRRGRSIGEVSQLLKISILKNSNKKNVKVYLDEVDALEYAIKISKKDDIIIVFYENIEPLLNYINNNEQERINKMS